MGNNNNNSTHNTGTFAVPSSYIMLVRVFRMRTLVSVLEFVVFNDKKNNNSNNKQIPIKIVRYTNGSTTQISKILYRQQHTTMCVTVRKKISFLLFCTLLFPSSHLDRCYTLPMVYSFNISSPK